MKRVIVAIVAVLFSVQSFAQKQQISIFEAVHAAVNWIDNRFNPTSLTVTNVYADTGLYGISMYEVETSIGQTVLLSGSRACLPILGVHYSDEGSYIENDSLPCGLQFMLDYYKERIDSCLADKNTKPYYYREWDTLINGIRQSIPRNAPIAPMLSSNWRQRVPNCCMGVDAYNIMCPQEDGCTHKSLAGCVAVAMGQVMYYWQYPVVTKKYIYQFDWCNMRDTLDTRHIVDPEYEKHRDAIAYLLRKCGQAVDMDYGCDGSSADTPDAADALHDRFGYHEDIEHKYKFWYDYFPWKAMVLYDLYQGRPVIYHGKRKLFSGGHAFICDGYDGDDLFHFNWGWKTYYNRPGDLLTLNDPTPTGDSNYQYWQGAIFHIYPTGQSNVCMTDMALDNFYSNHPLLNNNAHAPYEITPRTMTILTSASASSPASWRTIPSGASAVYQAHEEINLQDGFEAEYGSEFEAWIEPCELCDGMRGTTAGEKTVPGNDGQGQGGETDYLPSPRRSAVDIDLYPNPTDGPLTMAVDGEVREVMVSTLDGRPVGGWHLTALTETAVNFDVSPLAPGVYLLTVATSAGIHTARFIKQ